MKALFLTIMLASSAYAQESYELPEGALKLTHLTSATVRFSSLCTPGTVCVTDGTRVKLSFTLPGCVDKLGPVQYTFVRHGKYGRLLVAAQAVEVADSMIVKCFAPNVQSIEIPLVGRFQPINVYLMPNSLNP